MVDLTAVLFKRYNRVMWGTFVGVLLVACALVYFRFKLILGAETASLVQSVQEQAVVLDAIVKSNADAVNEMRIHAQSWYRLHPEGARPSQLRRALQPCPDSGRVCLDRLPPPWTTADAGNLTGLIDSPAPPLDKELEMALSLNDVFKAIKANLAGVTWAYYSSRRRFSNAYPWASSKEFFYTDTAAQREFLDSVERAPDPKRAVVWSPAYLDQAGRGVMITASAGVYGDGAFLGAVSIDVTLNWLNQFLRNWRSPFGTLFIINDRGQLIAHPTLVHDGALGVESAAVAFPRSLAQDMNATLEASTGRLVLLHGYYVETVAIQNSPFRLVLLAPQWALVSTALQTGLPSMFLLLISLAIMLVTASRFAYRDVIVPAQKLVRYIQDEQRGSVKSIPDIPRPWRPWFLTIQHVFNAHTQLVSIQQELDVARRMQQSIVPTRFPSRPDLQMFARMIPAKEVGGDFYDYFWLSDNKIGMVIADVSGKGVPAALFMAVARTLLRAIAPGASGPAACLALANDLLSQDNEATMFVTLFYGILDIRTGELEYANAGHNSPYVITADGKVSAVQRTSGMALGVMDGIVYEQGRMRLEPDSTLLLYTDGITEAFNPVNEQYGEARLASCLTGGEELTVEALLSQLVNDVVAFAIDAPQSDDITCFAVRFGAMSLVME
ncbi:MULTISPECIES: SpoIIE family protein phosphatase [unclassified Paraburkholderia]|uniref:SpoIIE family protein phosphatase n=1 Tax=unclassified Paraburkholderia TaxID=2615204 RepID=UPI002AB7C88E|nr:MULTISPECIES: SpoIIE family protein phosphatase [unclassified Paraburkholderia]